MSLAKNTAWNLFGAIAPLLVGLISIPILIRELGIELFGILTILWVVTGYFSLFDFGIGRALTQKISSGNRNEVDKPLISMGLILTIAFGMVGLSFVFFVSEMLAYDYLKISKENRDQVYYSLLISSIGVPLTTLSAAFRGILEGYELFAACNKAKIAVGVLLFVLPLLSVLFITPNLIFVSISLVIARLIGLIYFVHCLPMKKFFSYTYLNREIFFSLVKFGSWMSVTNLISPLLVNIDRFLISNILGARFVAFYTVPFEVIVRLLVIPSAIGSTLLPKLSSTFSNDVEYASKVVRNSALLVGVLLFLPVIVCFIIGDQILELFAGSEFGLNSYWVAFYISLGVLFNGIGYIYYTALHSMAIVKSTAQIHLIEAIIYLPALYVMIENYGVVGASITWCLRTLIDTILMFTIYKVNLKNV